MKKSQKIFIIFLTIILVIVALTVVVVKTKKSDFGPDGNTTAEIINNSANNATTDIKIENNNQNNNISDIINGENITSSTNISSNQKPSSNTKPSNNYDLTNAELIQSQKVSSYMLNLYSTVYNGKKIYLFTAEKDKNTFYFDIPGEYIIENIYYADIDENFGNEIIIRANTSQNTQIQTYRNYVLKITSNGFETLLNEQDMKSFSRHFTAELMSDCNIKISNNKTNYVKTINVSTNNISNKYWDESGKPTANSSVDFSNTFYNCEPKDVDSDGMYELYCSQYVSLGNKSNCIGYAYTTLKYNYQKSVFEISDTVFYAY